ncbi:AfsA-related hotdog domain-containing protein [Pseudomonas mangiferae]|uniref:A-factor biosynthesis hotdog domain-containing protein n=1 Tax=Pseudomonas mangiferae TaxID=2593654 RepID=A0A553GU33_9PSED|nr:AfsA-related hotdog domain-containing protein [Pseudomonas mangiferae]TRX72999.1 hypothetical protein FM069_19960 [Pseudomonas mangiferae]
MHSIKDSELHIPERYLRTVPVYAEELELDETDPFFFDHPVDHVPGMLLLDGLLSLAERALNASESTSAIRYVAELQLNFQRFAEKDAAIRLETVVGEGFDGRRRCDLQALQGEAPVCQGHVEFRRSAPAMASRSAGHADAPQVPAPADGVHKHHGENIFITDLHPTEDQRYRARLLPLATSHALHGRQRDRRTTLELVEACRQFSLLLQHRVHATPAGRPFILEAITARFRRAFSREARLDIVARAGQAAGTGNAIQFLELYDGDTPVGELALSGRAVSPRLYARIRQAHRAQTSENRP